jgi:prepilin-type N-terminal cleavage/methylation domain-containing protein
MNPITPARRCHGFTLIELLTVIAIIGILAAILIPTVGKVRFKAKEATKSSNYRQIWIANTVYANDNKGFLCPSQDADGDWRRALANYIQVKGVTDLDFRSIPLFIDPLFEEYDATVSSGTVTGIGMNDTLNTPINNLRNNSTVTNRLLMKIERVTFPERRVFIADSSGPGFLTTGNVETYSPGISATSGKTRHNGKNLIVRFNGSIATVSPAEAVAAVKDPSVPYVGN